MSINKGAWLMAKQAPFEVKESPMPEAGPNEVVVKIHSVALNPVDWMVQAMGIVYSDYPKIYGEDAAGEITAVGSAVTKFCPGDRVIAGVSPERKAGSDGVFQLYTKALEENVAKMPNSVSYQEGCVLPLGMRTAAAAMLLQDTLNLPLPKVPAAPSTGKVLLVWSGASSVGSCAIQLAVAAGLDVATTAGPSNQEHCRELGAKWVFDHTSDTVVDQVVAALSGKQVAGVMDAWSRSDAPAKASAVIAKLPGVNRLQTMLVPGIGLEGVAEGVEIGYTDSRGLNKNGLSEAVWHDWVPPALAAGTLKCKPDPFVVGKGLEAIQEACKVGLAGAPSCRKLVVDLV